MSSCSGCCVDVSWEPKLGTALRLRQGSARGWRGSEELAGFQPATDPPRALKKRFIKLFWIFNLVWVVEGTYFSFYLKGLYCNHHHARDGPEVNYNKGGIMQVRGSPVKIGVCL